MRKNRIILCTFIIAIFILGVLGGCTKVDKTTKDDLLNNEQLTKYISKQYEVTLVEKSGNQEKFVFESIGKSKMVWGGEVHFTNIDIKDEAKIEIKLKKDKITKFDISPVNVDFKPVLKNDVLTLKIKPNQKIWIELNGGKDKPLMVFVNPPKAEVPADAVYFPAGVHNIGRAYRVKSNTTLYLDDGAYLIGSIDARGSENVKIMGRGIVSGEYKTGAEVMAETANSAKWELFQEYFTIRGDNKSKNIVLEGITIANTPNYNTWYCSEFYNVKIISPWVYTSDGFHAVPSKEKPGVVKDCFAFVADDVFYCSDNVEGTLNIENCFASSTNNNIFLIGYWGWKMTHDNYARVKNIYVKPFVEHAIFQFVIDGKTSETGIKNQVFEDIYIEGNIKCPLIWIQNRYYPWPEQGKNNKLGNARNLVFKNITLSGRQFEFSKLLGLDAQNGLQDITLDNIVINKVKITKDNLSEYFETNEFVKNLIIK